MIPISMKLIQRPPSAAEIYKQTLFGTALGLTQTAKEGQAAVVSALKSTFTLRGNWFEQSNRFGIKIKPATKIDLSAEIRTLADWLELHETGKDKVSVAGHRISVPIGTNLRTRRGVIPRRERPRALRDAGAFIIQTKKGPVLFKRFQKGKRKGLVPLFGFEPKVRIRKQSTFYDPITRVVKARLDRNVGEGIARAFATMKR